MANITSNSLFIVSALVFVVGLLFLAYPYLTLLAVSLCAIGYSCYTHSSELSRYYSNWSATYWPPVSASERAVPFASSLLSGAGLPSPIPHIPSGIETFKNRRSPADEIVSSTPRCSPVSNHGSASPIPIQLQMRPSADVVTSDSRQLNFGRIATPKTSRMYAQDVYQNNVEAISNQGLRNRSNGNKVIQTTAGPLLASSRYNPSFDAGIFVNVNSPGFTDRLVRCASDNTAINWGHGGPTRQDKYGSVGLFPIVHLNTPTTPALSARNSQKAPNSNVRVRIAAPAYPEQRQHPIRGNTIQMRSYVPTRESSRRNEVAKSVLESLQEASRKRIYSQCQEVMEEDSGKKRQRKGESALPNPNCDMYQYRHIRAPSIPSSGPSENHPQSKRVHEDPSPRANEPKRHRQHGRPQSTNNEISSSLSSSKTLLQRLGGSKRKADYECSEGSSEKHFKDASNAASVPSTSRWLYSRPCDEGESAARTQEVVRSQKKSSPDSSAAASKIPVQKRNVEVENSDHSGSLNSASTVDSQKALTEPHDKLDTDLSSKLFRKDTVSRSHPKVCQPEKKGSSWAQEPPDADERCLLEQSNSSDIDRPERFQSLLSRMCGQEALTVKPSDGLQLQTPLESLNSNSAPTTLPDLRKTDLNVVTAACPAPAPAVSNDAVPLSAAPAPFTNSSSLAVSNPELTKSLSAASVVQMSVSSAAAQTSYLSSVFPSPSFAPLPFRASPSQDTKVTAPVEQDKTDGPTTSLAPILPIVSLSSPPAKPMFNFSPPTSLSAPRPAIPHTLSLTTPSVSSPSGANPPPSISSTFKFAVSQVKPSTVLAEHQSPITTDASSVPSKPPAAPSPAPAPAPTPSFAQGGGFSFLSGHTSGTVGTFSTDCGKIPTTSVGTVKFSLPSEKPQFSTGSGTFVISQEPQANGPPNVAPDLMTSSIPAVNSNQTLTLAATNNGSQKSSLGGFHFSGSSGSIFGQSAPNGVATIPPFSFASTATSAASATAEKSALDSKSVVGSGSITFGTVSTAVQPTNSGAFSFSSSPASTSTSASDAQKSLFQLNSFSTTTTNSDSSGFRNPPQGLFNGFASASNPTAPVAPSFGSSPQNQQQNQQLGSGMFSFGSSLSQPQPSVTFGAQPTPSSAIFGEGAGAPQQQNFGTTTTAGFPSQSTLPTFRSLPFGPPAASTSLNCLPFGQSQPSTSIACGGPVASNNAPAFGLPTSNPPTFGNNSVSTVPTSFGAAFPPPFAVSAEPSFGSSPSSVQVAPLNSAFSFGASTGKPTTPAFNFGGNAAAATLASAPSPAPASTFSFGGGDQQQQSGGIAPFQFGHTANSAGASASAFQFGSPSAQPGGSGSFSMGSGPSTPQRSRSLQTRRKRIQ